MSKLKDLNKVFIASIFVFFLGSSVCSGQSSSIKTSDSALEIKTSPHQVFCLDALYVMNSVFSTSAPTDRSPGAAASSIRYSVYRSGATMRVLTMAIAAKCDLTPFLVLERNVLETSVKPNTTFIPTGGPRPSTNGLGPVKSFSQTNGQ